MTPNTPPKLNPNLFREQCQWTENETGQHETACGEMHEFTNGGVRDNDYSFCPYCSKPINEVRHKEEKE